MLRRIEEAVPDLPALNVGDSVDLFWIDEPTDDEGKPFRAQIVAASEEGSAISLTFEADHDEALLERLRWCAERNECYLHFLFSSSHGNQITQVSPGVLLDVWSPDGTPVTVQDASDGTRRIRVVTYVDSKTTRSPRRA